ncbi:MAG: glutamate-5-semialdehyde dehydrogenase [Verrucomicrobiota bacterium]
MDDSPNNTTSIKDQILTMGAQALEASRELATFDSDHKNRILLAMADRLIADEAIILEANAKDITAAEKNGLTSAMIDRLKLDPQRLAGIADGIRQVAKLHDPVGELLEEWVPKNGITIRKKRTPIGVIGIIYESRPNVTSDAGVLCFKTGNAVILRGGSEAIHSNRAIADSLQNGGMAEGMPQHAVQLIPFTDRESVKHMAEMDQYLDLIIPRGGAGLIETVVSLARMPVIKHYDGICHAYVDVDANLDMAEAITINAKTQKPSVCNALETLLIHQDVAEKFAPLIAESLRENKVQLIADEKFIKLIDKSNPHIEVQAATEADWRTEYLDLILSIKIVADQDEAMNHINHYGSHHSDVIITDNETHANRFLAEVDSAAVFWNCSTRFSDGEEFGFGAEIGISTDKLHARGPMALKELTSYKYQLIGTGQVR